MSAENENVDCPSESIYSKRVENTHSIAIRKYYSVRMTYAIKG